MKRDPAPELVSSTLAWSFSHTNHHPGQDSSSPIAVDMAMGGPQCCDHLGPMPLGFNYKAVYLAGSAQAYEPKLDGGNSYLSVCNLYKLLTSQLDRGSGERRKVTHLLVDTL